MEEHEDMSFSTRIVRRTKFYIRVLWKRYQSLALRGKIVLFALIFFYGLLGFFATVWPGAATIAQTLYNWAHRTSQLPYGWAVFLGIITLVSFPPAAGHTTTLILCGFAYGMKGFYLAAGASVFASALVFVTLRALFSRRLRAWSATNEKWQALESVIKAKGLPLICLIRMSPLPPWVYSNALFASIGPVKLWQFVVAQTFVFPKILLSVFIGSRAAALADGDQRGHMDRLEKWLNIGLIALSMSVGFATSWFIYRQVRARIRHIDGVPPMVDELAAEAIEDVNEDAPLLGV